MNEYEEDSTDEDMFEDEDVEIKKPQMRHYEVVMQGAVPKDREVFQYFGFLGLNPVFVMIQDENGLMQFVSEWRNVWTVRAIPQPQVISLVKN